MSRRRDGFTILETILALGALGIALVLISQLAVQSLTERRRSEERLAAIEHCNNVLETARALPWSKLTTEWAKELRLPDQLAERMLEPAFSVRVESHEPHVKRVIVELKWFHGPGVAARPAMLTSLFADRAGEETP